MNPESFLLMPESDLHSTSKEDRFLRLQGFVASTLVAIILIVLYWNKLSTYSVGGDDYSLIVASRSLDLYSWFFSGFSDYFYVFDGTLPYTNFVRPVVNFIFWLNNHLFAEKIGLYFLSTILFIAFYCHSLLRLSGYRLLGVLLISLFCLASPSIVRASLGSPPFAFDVLAAAFVLAAINASFRNRYYISLSLLFLAVFTKEVGLAACIAFAIYTAIMTRKTIKGIKSLRPSAEAIGYLSPVAIYAVIRYYGVGMGGTYSTNSLDVNGLIKNAFYFAFKFPMGFELFSGTRSLLFSGQFGEFTVRLVPLIVNFLVLIGSVCMVAGYVKACQKIGLDSQSRASKLAEENILILCVLSVTSIYLCLTGAGGRFYPLPQGCLLVLLVRGIDNEIANKRLLRMAMIALLAVYSLLFAYHVKSALAFKPLKVDSVLASVAAKAKRLQAKNILLVNAPDFYSSPKYVAKYYNFIGDLDFLYNSKGSCGGYPQYNLFKNPGNSRYSYTIKPVVSVSGLLSAADCDPDIAFNGYTVKQGGSRGSKDVYFFVSGNEFRYSFAKSGARKMLDYVGIARNYDAIFVANYETGEAKVLAPVDSAH